MPNNVLANACLLFLIGMTGPLFAQDGERWLLRADADLAVEPFRSGANAAKWLETLRVWPLDGDTEACALDRTTQDLYRAAFQGLDPFLLRFPGGGDQSQFVHLGSGLPGYGFDLSVGGEVFQYMVKKDPFEWARRRSDQLALPERCRYLDLFVDLARDNPGKDLVYTANVLTGTPQSEFRVLRRLLDAGLTLRGVEMGNEMYGFTVWDWDRRALTYWYDPSDGGRAAGEYLRSLLRPNTECLDGHCSTMSFVSMIDSLERAYGVHIPLGVTAAPPLLGNEDIFVDSLSERRLRDWNDTLALYREAPWLDAFIVHLYARQLRIPCDGALRPVEDSLYTAAELDTAFHCLQEAIKAYFGPVRRFPGGDNLRRHLKGLTGAFASRLGKENELWITEWSWNSGNRYDVSLLSNTFLDAVFTQRWLHEMLLHNTVLVNAPPGLRVSMVQRQLLTGTNENSLIGPRTLLDHNYRPDPGMVGTPWGPGSPKSPPLLRRISYWPMERYTELSERRDLHFVPLEGPDTTGNLHAYAYRSEGPDSGTIILDLFYSWTDAEPLPVDFGIHGIQYAAGTVPYRLADRMAGPWHHTRFAGERRHASPGYNKYTEIAAYAPGPPPPVPDYAYAFAQVDSGTADTLVLAPFSFGHLRLTLLAAPEADGMPRRDGPEGHWRVWPNPARDILHLRHDAVGNREATLSDAFGRALRRMTVPDHATLALPVRELPPGIYFLHGAGLDAARISLQGER